MLDYTLEEVLDFINGEIEDAYTEASKGTDSFKDFLKSKIEQQIKEGNVIKLSDLADFDNDLDDDIEKAMDKYHKTHDTTYLDIANDLRREKELDGKMVEPLTNKILIESIKDYTEASKEDADAAAKEGESYRKSSSKYKSRPSKGDKRNPKGDLEAIRRKNIRKSFYNKDQDQPDNMAYNMKHFDPDTFKKFSAGTDYFDSSNYTKKSPYYNTYKDNEEDIEKLRFAKQTNAYGNKPSYLFGMMKSDDTIKDKLDKDEAMNELKLRMSAKLADKAEKGFKSKAVEERYNKWKSRYESVIENIIEAYEYDVISYEDANDYLDMISLFED